MGGDVFSAATWDFPASVSVTDMARRDEAMAMRNHDVVCMYLLRRGLVAEEVMTSGVGYIPGLDQAG